MPDPASFFTGAEAAAYAAALREAAEGYTESIQREAAGYAEHMSERWPGGADPGRLVFHIVPGALRH